MLRQETIENFDKALNRVAELIPNASHKQKTAWDTLYTVINQYTVAKIVDFYKRIDEDCRELMLSGINENKENITEDLFNQINNYFLELKNLFPQPSNDPLALGKRKKPLKKPDENTLKVAAEGLQHAKDKSIETKRKIESAKNPQPNVVQPVQPNSVQPVQPNSVQPVQPNSVQPPIQQNSFLPNTLSSPLPGFASAVNRSEQDAVLSSMFQQNDNLHAKREQTLEARRKEEEKKKEAEEKRKKAEFDNLSKVDDYQDGFYETETEQDERLFGQSSQNNDDDILNIFPSDAQFQEALRQSEQEAIRQSEEDAQLQKAFEQDAIINAALINEEEVEVALALNGLVNSTQPARFSIPAPGKPTQPAAQDDLYEPNNVPNKKKNENEDLLTIFNRYITRIETNDVKSKPHYGIFKLFEKLRALFRHVFKEKKHPVSAPVKTDFSAGFIIFKKDRSLNREINNKVAHYYCNGIQNNSLPPNAFKEADKIRKDIIAKENIHISRFFYHGIKSDELNKAIAVGIKAYKP